MMTTKYFISRKSSLLLCLLGWCALSTTTTMAFLTPHPHSDPVVTLQDPLPELVDQQSVNGDEQSQQSQSPLDDPQRHAHSRKRWGMDMHQTQEYWSFLGSSSSDNKQQQKTVDPEHELLP